MRAETTSVNHKSEPSNQFRMNISHNALAKRIFDIAAASALILILLPVIVSIYLLVILLDGAPVLYGHSRIGRGGKAFKCWKFRTMVRDSDKRLAELLKNNPAARDEWEATRKLRNDPRIIPGIGRFLRKTSLDELPQLFNVLAGQMSMVGPRPVVRGELSRYGAFRTHYTSVRPGLTGPWQIGERSNDDYDNRIDKDVKYIENWSLGGDFEIVLKTARVVVDTKGAY